MEPEKSEQEWYKVLINKPRLAFDFTLFFRSHFEFDLVFRIVLFLLRVQIGIILLGVFLGVATIISIAAALA